MQARQMELFAKPIEELEQEEFISILHHDANKRGGMFTRLSIKENIYGKTEIHENWSSKNAYPLMTLDPEYNRYIALNSFHNIKESAVHNVGQEVEAKEEITLRRKETHLHAITTVYIDLDWHDGTKKEIQKRINNTKELLEDAYKENWLPRPTMITETGRGLGVFYVLNKSIANTERTGKQISFWEYICREYAKKYQELFRMSKIELLEVDFKVAGDTTRVVRLPGTLNHKSKSQCRLIRVHREENGAPVYYSLNELVQYIEDYKVYEKPYNEIRKKIAQNKIVNFSAYSNPFLVERLEKLKRVQELVIDKKEGCRENLCFIFYNTAKQLMTEKEAYKEMLEFNSMFRYPITDQKELQNIIVSTAGAADKEKNQRGFYKYKDITLKELLEITDEQNEYVGFGIARKEMLRKQKKEANRKKRLERNENIIAYVVEHPEATYEEIAGLFEVSLRTLKNVLKEADVHRYQKQVRETSCCAAEKKNPDIRPVESFDNIIRFMESKKNKKTVRISQKRKVQKNASVSFECCLATRKKDITDNKFNLSKDDSTYSKSGNMYLFQARNINRNISVEDDGWYMLDSDDLVEIPFEIITSDVPYPSFHIKT